MTSLEVVDWFSCDVPYVWGWVPNSPSEVAFQLTLSIGEVNKPGSNDFHVFVATIEGFECLFDELPSFQVPDRAILLFREYSWEALHSRVQKILETAASESWSESISRLQRYFVWEYEDLRVE